MKTLTLLLFAAASATLHAVALPESAKIDQLLAADWQKHNVQVNPAAPDEVIVRRLYLDVAGRIPTVDETEQFMRSNDPQKRAKLIDQLLAGDGFTSHMFNYWADVLRLTDNVKGRLTAEAYEEWMKKQLQANTPYDEVVRKLLTTEGGAWDSGSIGFWMRDENKLDHLAYTVQVFLGTSIVCAQCHNHPFDKWTQMDYYGMAAFTYGMNTRGGGQDILKTKKKPDIDKAALKAMSDKERREYMKKMRSEQETKPKIDREDLAQVRQAMGDVMKPLRYTDINWQEGKRPTLPQDYKYTDAKPGQQVPPKAMFGHEASPLGGETSLAAFARWMTSPENPRFTTVIANRMWKKVFGLGLIEPVDEMTDSTVASNPALMDYLTQLMIEKKYSLKSFLRILYNTDAYQRMATTQEVALGETSRFTGPLLRRMSAEQIWDSLVTLSAGNLDSSVDADNERLHQYLDDLAFFLNTIQNAGVEGLVDVAKEATAKQEDNQKKLAEMRQEVLAKQKKGEAGIAETKELAQEANKLRREAGNDILVALLGDERATDLRRGYNAKQQVDMKKRPAQIDRSKLANMSKEERKAFIKKIQQGAQNVVGLSTRASELPSPAKAGHMLRTFGQSDREVIENASADASVPQALTLLNGPIVQAVTSPMSNLSTHLEKAAGPEQKLDLLYTALLSRKPTNNERGILSGVIHERGAKAVEDVTHALLTGSQFLFIQ
ncbi:MAG: DUF1549 domain-containing protein [Verrucomicrobiota bacterium]